MAKTRIFVSSTCYDLSQERENIKQALEALGHEALLSDFSPFPISPDLGAVENCLNVVREHSDILVLVIGGRRGSLAADSGKTVTNLEYIAATRRGIPVYVFVKRAVWSFLEVWNKHPGNDFSPEVDDPSVFQFIQELLDVGAWVSQFDRASDLVATLRDHLSTLFRDLLLRRREGRISIPPEFAQESMRAKDLAVDRPPFWEYLLTVEILQSKLERTRRLLADLGRGEVYCPLTSLTHETFSEWFGDAIDDILLLMDVIHSVITNGFARGWGALGEPGDPVEILRVCENLASTTHHMAEWAVNFRSVDVPEEMNHLKMLLQDWPQPMVEQILAIPDRIAAPVQRSVTGTIEILVVFEEPENIAEVHAELARLKEKFGFLQ